MCQAASLRACVGDACGCGNRVMEEGRGVRPDPEAAPSFLGGSPGEAAWHRGRARHVPLQPGMCASLAAGTEGTSRRGARCDLAVPTTSRGDVGLSCRAPCAGERGWGRCCRVPGNAQSTRECNKTPPRICPRLSERSVTAFGPHLTLLRAEQQPRREGVNPDGNQLLCPRAGAGGKADVGAKRQLWGGLDAMGARG